MLFKIYQVYQQCLNKVCVSASDWRQGELAAFQNIICGHSRLMHCYGLIRVKDVHRHYFFEAAQCQQFFSKTSEKRHVFMR